MKDVDADRVRKVGVIGGKLDANVKQAGVFEVKQAAGAPFNMQGCVVVDGTVDVHLVNQLAASLDISAEELYVKLYETGVRLSTEGMAADRNSETPHIKQEKENLRSRDKVQKRVPHFCSSFIVCPLPSHHRPQPTTRI